MECKHKWVPTLAKDGSGLYQDTCAYCGSLGIPDWNNTKNGFTPIIAKPLANVINLAEYRKKREVESGKVSKGNSGSNSTESKDSGRKGQTKL